MGLGEDDDVELPDELKEVVGAVVDEVLPPGFIDVQQEIGSTLPERVVLERVHHHFAHAGLGYRYRGEDTFKLKVRSRKYPMFGAFSGKVHIIRKVPFHNNPHYPRYALQGVLQYHPSVLWCLGVLLFFALLAALIRPGAVVGWGLFLLGSGITLFSSFRLGREERDEAEARVEAAFLRLRTTVQNIR